MKSAVIIIFIFLNFGFLYAQTADKPGSISGKITDAKDHRGIDADVKLFHSHDSTIISGTKCDTTGTFSISKIAYGTYKIEVSYVGYSSLILDNISVDVNSPSKSFDTLKLKLSSSTTEEIDVEGN